MAESKIIISPGTKIGELLHAYPELEPVLMGMSPAFEKLKNPILRKTVAKVATLQQVSVVGGVNLNEMIRILRQNAGQDITGEVSDNQLSPDPATPDWLDSAKIKERLDVSPIINSGESPMKEILHQVSQLKPGEIFELQTPFTPAPIIDILNEKKFKVYTIVNNNNVLTYISK